jgi:hypothetical protein
VGGTGQSARATPDGRRLGTVAKLFRKKSREVLGDGRIGCVWQAQLLEANPSLPRRQFAAGDSGEESFDQDLIEVFSQ